MVFNPTTKGKCVVESYATFNGPLLQLVT